MFSGNIDFAADDQRALSCFIHEARLMCLFIVYETMFTIGESRTTSPASDTEQQAQVAGNPRRQRFSTKTPLKNERRRQRQQEAAKQREHFLAQRRQRFQHSDHKHVQRQQRNTTITLQMKPMKRGNTDKIRQATLAGYSQIIFFDATIATVTRSVQCT